MSIKGYSEQERVHRKSTKRLDDSGELDVFEATRYFSSCNEAAGYHGALFTQKASTRDERQGWAGRRMSLDMPTTVSLPSQSHRVDQEMKEKKYKQPSSPGGRLASFLNSLFQQSASKKKKSKSSLQSMKDEEENSNGRRKRRSSISLFQVVNTKDSKSVYASSTASGFRTPPPYVDTPTKGYRDLKSYSDHKHVVSVPKYSGMVKPVTSQDEAMDEKKDMDFAWLDEKVKFIDSFSEKNKDRIWVDKSSLEKKKVMKRVVEVDDGAESDSSSDLFELENYDLGSYSSDLPVYETTHMESIKRGAPISNGAL